VLAERGYIARRVPHTPYQRTPFRSPFVAVGSEGEPPPGGGSSGLFYLVKKCIHLHITSSLKSQGASCSVDVGKQKLKETPPSPDSWEPTCTIARDPRGQKRMERREIREKDVRRLSRDAKGDINIYAYFCMQSFTFHLRKYFQAITIATIERPAFPNIVQRSGEGQTFHYNFFPANTKTRSKYEKFYVTFINKNKKKQVDL
jgi:hypothetical protein